MARISLAPYSLRFSLGEGDDKQYFYPDELPPTPDTNVQWTLQEVFNGFLTTATTEYHEITTTQKMLGVEHWIRDNRTVSGIFRSGEWGYGTLLVDTDHRLANYPRVSSQAELMPFYFSHHYSPDRVQSILLLQKFKQFGILSAFKLALETYIAQIGLDVRVELYPLVPTDYVQQLIEGGTLKSIQFIKHEIPNDIVDLFDEGTTEVHGSMSLSINASRSDSLPFINWIRNQINNTTLGTAEQIEVLDEEFDEIKFTVDIGGTKRTIAIQDLHAIRPAYPITDQVEFGDDGHPTWDTIHNVGLQVLNNLRTSLWQNEQENGEPL